MNRTTLQTLAGCLLALTIGAAAGSLRGFLPTKSPAPPTLPSTPPPNIAPSSYSESFIQDVRTEKGAKRWLLLLSAAETATPADLSALIRIVGEDSAAVRMLGARWAELDPHHMFTSLYADFMLPENAPGVLPSRWILTEVLFEQWTKADTTGAIKALTDVPNFSARESLRMTVVNQVMKVDIEEGIRVMKEWNIRHYLPDMAKLTEWAEREPERAAEAVLGLGADFALSNALQRVGTAWGKNDPKGGLRFAAKLEARARGHLASEIVKQWATSDLAAAVEFASAETDPALRAALAQGLVGVWGKTDPAAALAWSQENLRGTARNEAIASLVKSAAEKSLTTASELVADMEPGPAQNRACASIFETWFNKGKGERDAAFEWLASLPDPEARRAAMERVQWNWMWRDPAGAREFIAGPHGDLASQSMVHQVARNQATKNPETAMQWASTLPAERAADARAAVLEGWLNVRPEGAADYARKLPRGEERDRAIRTISQNMIWQNIDQAGPWLKSLPSADQKIVREIFEGTNLPEEQKAKLRAVTDP